MARVVKLGSKRPVTRPLLPDPEPRPVKYTMITHENAAALYRHPLPERCLP